MLREQVHKINPVYSRVYPYLEPHIKFVFLGILFSALVSLAGGSFPWILKKGVDSLFNENNVYLLFPILSGITAAILLFFLLSFIRDYLMKAISLNISIDLRDQFINGVIKKNSLFFSKKRVGELMSMVNHDLTYVENIPELVIRIYIEFPMRIIILFTTMVYMNVKLSAISLLIAPPAYFLLQKSRNILRLLSTAKIKSISRVHADLQEIFTGIPIIKLWNIGAYCRDKISRDHVEYKKQSLREVKINAILKGSLTLMVILILNLILYISVSDFGKGNTTPGDYMGFILALWLMLQPVKQMGMGYSSLVYAGTAAERILNIFENNNDVEPNLNKGRHLSSIERIDFEKVFFSYKDRTVLRDLNMSFRPGNIYLISGENGSGKTTILNSLLGLRLPDKGTILINGDAFSTYKLTAVRSRVSYVPQDTFVFHDSVRENILLGSKLNGTGAERYRQAKEMSTLQDALAAMGKKDDTVLSEKGDNFSGGEKQRIAVARALFKIHDLLILDEANANISQKKFEEIMAAISLNKADKIIILVSHDPVYRKYCDVVYKIVDGTISL